MAAMPGWLRLARTCASPLEPGEAVWIGCERVGEDLQRDIAAELGVGRLIDLSHPSLADEGGHVVVAESGADLEGHVSTELNDAG